MQPKDYSSRRGCNRQDAMGNHRDPGKRQGTKPVKLRQCGHCNPLWDTEHQQLVPGPCPLRGQARRLFLKPKRRCFTESEELKALGRIRAILERLGPSSYLTFTLAGVLELAEENIKNDLYRNPMDRIRQLEEERQTEKGEASGEL